MSYSKLQDPVELDLANYHKRLDKEEAKEICLFGMAEGYISDLGDSPRMLDEDLCNCEFSPCDEGIFWIAIRAAIREAALGEKQMPSSLVALVEHWAESKAKHEFDKPRDASGE